MQILQNTSGRLLLKLITWINLLTFCCLSLFNVSTLTLAIYYLAWRHLLDSVGFHGIFVKAKKIATTDRNCIYKFQRPKTLLIRQWIQITFNLSKLSAHIRNYQLTILKQLHKSKFSSESFRIKSGEIWENLGN